MADPVAIGSGVLGAVGTALGIYNFFHSRSIDRRGKAPHFVFDHLLIDHQGASGPAGAYDYRYPFLLAPIDGKLQELFDKPKQLPQNYPSGRVVAVVVKNAGFQTKKCVSANASETFRLLETGSDYEMRYIHDADHSHKEIEFDLKYETADGFQGSQRWKLEAGAFKFTRLKPTEVKQ